MLQQSVEGSASLVQGSGKLFLEFNDINMTGKLYRLGLAIAMYEGWFAGPSGRDGNSYPSVSYRNHNPGNLRSSFFQLGQRDGFAFFYNDDVGFSALLYDLLIKASGKSTTGLKADSTLRELIFKYAPPVENDSEAYLSFILQQTGFSADLRLKDLLTD